MAKSENDKKLEDRIADLEKQIKDISERTGGMLSSRDFRDLVITKEKDEDYAELHRAFCERNWGKKVGRRFIIDPYDELNLTPFSYDLSIGNDILSVRKKDPIRKRLPYEVMPGETVIVLTREFIALPPCYSATVWPRFKLVRGGVFQSMVKIDPTWYGKLGVAMTNLSSRTIPLTEGMAFGTLVMYELSSNTDLDLWQPEKLKDIRVEIPNIPLRKTLQKALVKADLTSVCWVEDNSLVVRGLKKTSYDKLRKIDGSKPWLDTVEKAKAKWLELEDRETKRKSIGMEALGMKDLEKLTDVLPMGEALKEEKVRERKVTDDELYNVAVEYGKPFDLIANIPKLVGENIERESIPKIHAGVVERLFPQIVILTIRIIALLSLIGVAVAIAGRYIQGKVTWPGILVLAVIPVMYFFLIWALQRTLGRDVKSDAKIKSPRPWTPPKNIEEEYRFPKFVSFVWNLLGRLKKK